jgi:sulfur relay (sulfurtransferase) DsrC/TusE family protein
MHNNKGYQTNKNEWLDTLATKIAEIRLSELGFNFIPGIAPYFRRFRKSLEAKAFIVKSVSLITDEGNIKRKT